MFSDDLRQKAGGNVLIRFIGYIVVAVVFAVSASVIWYTHEMKILTAFQAMKKIDVVPEAQALEQDKGRCQALEYLDYMREYDYVKTDPEVTAYYDKLAEDRYRVSLILREFIKGIIFGKGDCVEAWGAATAADFFLVGDIRDLTIQILNWIQRKNVDEFTAVLSGVGILTTTIPPAEGAVCALKLGKRMNKLSPSFQESIIKVGTECTKAGNLRAFKPVTDSLYSIFQTKGVKAFDVMSVLKHCDNVNDLKTMKRFASTFGDKTGKFLRLGGRSSLDTFKKYENNPALKPALEKALQYGSAGTDILKKVGPERFLRYTKYGARGMRTLWQGRLQMYLMWLFKMIPEWLLWSIAAVTGFVTFGAPTRLVLKRLRRVKRSA